MAKKNATKHKSAAESGLATAHKVARTTYEVDRKIRMAEVLASGDNKRIERYFLRRWAYKMFGRFMGKTINRI